MQDRPVIVRDGSSTPMLALVIIVIVAAAVALYFWQPWNAQGHASTTTIITQPAPAGNGSNAQSSSANGSSGSTNSKP